MKVQNFWDNVLLIQIVYNAAYGKTEIFFLRGLNFYSGSYLPSHGSRSRYPIIFA